MLNTQISPAHVYIATLDVWQLRQLRWPIMRVFARRFVEQAELRRYLRELLAGGAWADVIAVPRDDDTVRREPHVFDIYGLRKNL
jgi:hypothetical protein